MLFLLIFSFYFILPYSAHEPSYIIGKYLSFIREYARLKTAAVTPEPHENTILFSLLIPILLNFSLMFTLFKKVLVFGSINSPKGRLYEFLIEPL